MKITINTCDMCKKEVKAGVDYHMVTVRMSVMGEQCNGEPNMPEVDLCHPCLTELGLCHPHHGEEYPEPKPTALELIEMLAECLADANRMRSHEEGEDELPDHR